MDDYSSQVNQGYLKDAVEKDPNGLDASEPGAKLDQGKILGGVLEDFKRSLLAVAEVGTVGANKYSRSGWISVPNGEVRYKDAMWRHLLATDDYDNGECGTGLLHLAQVAWNALAQLEMKLKGMEDSK